MLGIGGKVAIVQEKEIEANKTINYLTLGDGDFSYSFDLCRFFQASQVSDSLQCAYRIVCTSIDTLEESMNKYHDAGYTLNRIRAINDGNHYKETTIVEEKKRRRKKLRSAFDGKGTKEVDCGSFKNRRLATSIHHGVNAIHPWNDESGQTGKSNESFMTENMNVSEPLKRQKYATIPIPPLPLNLKYQAVIFNHPHLGTENASLHSQFLSHLFYSCVHHWLDKGGVLHLTLVKKQCERWDCINRARKIGLKLLHKRNFTVPPPPGVYLQYIGKTLSMQYEEGHQLQKIVDIQSQESDDEFKNRYHCRRHQSGKSFATRIITGGSETLTFRRKDDDDLLDGLHYLPWELTQIGLDKNNKNDYGKLLKCFYCDKQFMDERGRKNHIKCVHPNGIDKEKTKTALVCNLCNIKDGSELRVFSSLKALEDHKKSKHSGMYTNIKPDWAAKQEQKMSWRNDGGHHSDEYSRLEMAKKSFESCKVCGLKFTTLKMKEIHFQDFLPSFKGNKKEGVKIMPFVCSRCGKEFKDQRALRQHFNFCLR